MVKNILNACLCFAAYLALSVFYAGLYGHNIFTEMLNPGGDQNYFLFFLKWWPWAIAHHINPLATDYLTYPNFYNLAWLTSIPALSLIASPLTHYFGVVFSWNILIILAPVTASFSAYILFRYLNLAYFASFIGGIIFGFSTYEMSEVFSGHIHLIYVFPIPLFILVLLMRFSRRIGKTGFIIYGSILMALLPGISTEIIATFVVFLALSFIIFILYNLRDKNNLKRIYSLAGDTIIAGIAALILCSPFIYYLIIGLKNAVSKPILFSAKYNSAEFLNYIIPTSFTKIGGGYFQDIASRFTKGNAYVGIGLIIISALSMIETKKHRRANGTLEWAKPLMVITIMLAVFSLGPYLHIDGFITMIPLPEHLFIFPPLNNAAPNRFAMYVFLCIAFWTALWISKKTKNEMRPLKYYGSYLFLIISLILIIPNYSSNSWSKPDFNKNAIKIYIPEGSNILPIPFSNYYAYGALWVAGSNFNIHMTGPEWGFSIYKHYRPVYRILNDNKVNGDYIRQIRTFCVLRDVNYIVISANKKKMLKIWEPVFNKIFGKYKITGGGLVIYKVHKLN